MTNNTNNYYYPFLRARGAVSPLKNTRPKIATCNRCGQIVLACTSDGFRTAVDPHPLKFSDIRNHIVAKRDVYRILYVNQKPVKLSLATVGMLSLPGAQEGAYVAAHGCGCHGMDSTSFEEPEAPPGPPVAVSDDHKGRSPVRTVTNRPIEAALCHNCGGLIPEGDIERIELRIPVWDVVHHHVPNRGTRRGYDKTYEGWGEKRWAIHLGGCPPTTKRNQNQNEPDGGK